MKKSNSIFCLATSACLVLGGMGCHKQATGTSDQPKTVEEGIARLQTVLAAASPQAQSNYYNGVAMGMRYGDRAKSIAALEQIAADPSLNDQQKKLVGQVSDLLKQSAAGQPAPAH